MKKGSHQWSTQHNKETESGNHSRSIGRREVEVEIREEDYAWLKKCYVGEALSAKKLTGLQESIWAKGYHKCLIRHMGGMLVLLSSEDDEEIRRLVENEREWNNWKVGDVLEFDEDTITRRRFDIPRVKVLTPVTELISCPINVKINGQAFKIQVNEEVCVASHHPNPSGVMDSPCYGGRSTEHSKTVDGSDAGAGNNSKSTNEDKGESIGQEVNEEFSNNNSKENICRLSAGSGGSTHLKESITRKKDVHNGLQVGTTAQDMPRGGIQLG
ncbi:hypothetical protein Ancab_012218 [Ancistrocladus abbreviatus]